MNLHDDDFTLLGLPRQFTLERAHIDAGWKALQQQVHPDRHADQGAAAQRVAMQWSVRVNEAVRRLRDPVQRAAYLCELAGAALGVNDNTAMPADFLMQQMSWREAMAEARGPADLMALERQVRQAREALLAQCAAALDPPAPQPAQAVQPVRALMFVERLLGELEDRLADDAATPV